MASILDRKAFSYSNPSALQEPVEDPFLYNIHKLPAELAVYSGKTAKTEPSPTLSMSIFASNPALYLSQQLT